MPIYTVEIDGKRYDIQGDRQPTEAEARSAIGAYTPSQSKPTAPQPSLTDRAVDALPMLGGAAGGIIGGIGGTAFGMGIGGAPGAIGGATLGGGAGEAAKQLINRARGKAAPGSMTEAAADIGMEGATQGAMEAGGRVVGAGLRAAAPRLARIAINPIESVERKYPDIAQTYLKVGRLMGRSGVGAVGAKESAQQAADLASQAAQRSASVIAAADAAGAAPVRGRDVVSALRPAYDEAATYAKTGGADRRGLIISRVKSFARQNPTLTNAEASGLRASLDTEANKAMQAGIDDTVQTTGQMDKALANRLRGLVRLNVDATGVSPRPLAELTGETKSLMGLSKALDKASGRKHTLTRNLALTAGATGLGSGLLTGDPEAGAKMGTGTLLSSYLLTNPKQLGRAALFARNLAPVAEAGPTLTRAAMLLNALSGAEETR